MQKEGKRASFGYSWADEVEREEKEEELQRIEKEEKSNGKPNPFGAARPRELVLEEKGVDWRKLDQSLDQNPSNLRQDKKLKENICLTTPSISRQVQFSQGPRCPDQRKPETVITSPLVPPLRYPPKNIVALMEQIRRGRTDRVNPDQVSTHRPFDAARRVTARAHYNPNMEHNIRSENTNIRSKRKWFGERCFSTNDELQGDARRQVLVDLNHFERTDFGMHYESRGDYYQSGMERTAFEKNLKGGEQHNWEYSGDGNEGRCHPQIHQGSSEYYQPEIFAFEKNVKDDEGFNWEYSGDGIQRRDNPQIYDIARRFSGKLDGRVRRTASEVPKNGGNGGKKKSQISGDHNTKKKEKLFTAQPGPSNRRRHGKHCEK